MSGSGEGNLSERPCRRKPGDDGENFTNIADTEINAVVIDLKDDSGRVTCPMDSPLVTETEASTPYVQDMRELIRELKEEHGLYVIARVVAFRDPWLAEKKPECV